MNDQGSGSAALVQVLQSTTNAINAINHTLLTLLPNGAYVPFSQADSAASTDTVYFSTTTNLLTYKDSSGVANPLYYNTLNTTTTYDPPSIANGAAALSSGITVTGAILGDYVQVSAPYDLQGLSASAYVSASNTVKICLNNNTGGAIDLASGTWKIRVTK